MDETSFNVNCITKESFVDIASEKINGILCFPGNDLFRAWAVKFLQKASRGFGLGEHEPWLNSLSTVESSGVILSNCKYSTRKLDLATTTARSSLSLVNNYPLQFNLFISALASLFISQIEESQHRFCVSHEKSAEQYNAFQPEKSDVGISHGPNGNNNYKNSSEICVEKSYARNVSDSGPHKKRRTNYETHSLKTDEILRFLKHIWSWAKMGYVKLDTDLLGDVLSHLPECIEEVVLSWAREALGSSRRGSLEDHKGESISITSTGVRKDAVPSDDDMLHSLSVLQESPLFLAAAASSPKLFQRSTSVLNQLLILASECSCSWSLLLSLCKTFAQETAKGRAEFYTFQVQPLILLMEVDPNTFTSNEQRDFISSQLTSMCLSLPTEVTIAVLSHFPAWLPFLDHVILL